MFKLSVGKVFFLFFLGGVIGISAANLHAQETTAQPKATQKVINAKTNTSQPGVDDCVGVNCCNGEYMDDQEFCCGSVIYEQAEFGGGGNYACCNGKPYNQKISCCENNDITPLEQCPQICGTTKYDPDKQFCCAGEVYTITDEHYCCRNDKVLTKTQCNPPTCPCTDCDLKCCGAVELGENEGCCDGSQKYNIDTYECCSDGSVKEKGQCSTTSVEKCGPFELPAGKKCCNDEQGIFADLCCGRVALPAGKYCCNEITGKIADSKEKCNDTPVEKCGPFELPDGKKCCNDEQGIFDDRCCGDIAWPLDSDKCCQAPDGSITTSDGKKYDPDGNLIEEAGEV